MRLRSRGVERWSATAAGVALLLGGCFPPLAAGGARPSAEVSATVEAVLADLDGDRHADVAEALAGGGVTVRWAAGDGSHGAPVSAAEPSVRARRIAAADLTSDGVDDIVAFGASTLWVIPADGEGGFLASRAVDVPGEIRSWAIADLDRNGGLDIALATGRSELSLLMNRDDRSGLDNRPLAIGQPALSVAALSLDADAWPELAVGAGDGTLRVLSNERGDLRPSASHSLGFSPDLLAVGSLRGDGWSDLVAASHDGSVAVLAREAGLLGEPVASQLGVPLDRIAVGDVDADVSGDLVALSSGSVFVFPGVAGQRAFGAPTALAGSEATGVALVARNGFAGQDLFISRPSGATLTRAEVSFKRATFTVTKTTDAILAPPFEPNTLRWAVNEANTNPGPDTIVFNLNPGAAGVEFDGARLVFPIRLQAPLVLTDPLTAILGTAAPQVDYNPFGPEVEIVPAAGAFDAFVIAPSSGGNTISGLIVSGFTNGFNVQGPTNTISANYIGTNERGIAAARTSATGVLLQSDGNTVSGNVIGGNADGVQIANGADNNTVTNNIIGTDGATGLPLAGGINIRGVQVFTASGNTISDNVISGNGTGINATQSGPMTIARNAIGTDRLGAAAIGNPDGGVVLTSATGTTISPANIISNNAGGANFGGVALRGVNPVTNGALVSNNQLRANAVRGVNIESGDDNQIGPGNLITQSTGDGIAVVSGDGNVITTNSITLNGELGIDLVAPGDAPPGITPNDAGDADAGPNGLLNFPVITATSLTTENQVVASGTAPPGSTVEVFRSDATDPNGEGITFLGSTVATAAGTFSAALSLTAPLAEAFVLTATATIGDPTGEGTSEFGPNFILNQQVSVSPTSIDFGTTGVGAVETRVVTICNNGFANLTIGSVVVSPDGTAFSVSEVPAEGLILSPGECTTVTVTFAPTAEGDSDATLVITTDDPNTPQFTIPLSGNAVLGDVTIAVSSIQFPVTRVGRASVTSVAVTNPNPIPVTVTRIDFTRRETRKVSFVDDTDPYFVATPSAFTVPPNSTVDVEIVFVPKEPIRTPDLMSPFVLPSPAYQTPRNVRSTATFVVSDELGISVSVPVRGRVEPLPELTVRDGEIDGDTLKILIDAFDPNNNIVRAEVVLYTEALEVITRVEETPGLAKLLRRFGRGMKVPMTLLYSGLDDFTPSVKFIDVTLVDFDGNRSETERGEVIYINLKDGSRQPALVFPTGAFPGVAAEGPSLPPIELAPRRR